MQLTDLPPEMLTFDPATHTYRYAGKVVPGVTSLLDSLHSFAGVPWEVLEAARHRGSDVHLACQLFDENDLDEERLEAKQPKVHAYLKGWKKFLRDCQPNWVAIEEPVYHEGQAYAGTPDRFGGLLHKGRRLSIAQVDIKTAAASHPVWGVQLAAYNAAALYGDVPRLTCQLAPDGTYRLIEWTDPADWPIFLSLLNLHHWKERHGL